MSDEARVWERARRMREGLLAHDVAALRELCDDAFWTRVGDAELAPLARDAASVEMLGVLGRRSLMLVETPGAQQPRHSVEQQWAGERYLVEDQRLFSLVDRAEVEASGDEARLARLRTKLAAQDAGARYAQLLAGHDAAGAASMWTAGFRESHGDEVLPRIPAVRSAELIAGVGPRTLVRCRFDEGEETVEVLWRETEDGWLVQGARTFRPPG
ncbi:MAG TPA: hypothetical protein VFH74_08725 [Gaiellales bacterium]|nr:hypothetical protein [Gaiellales bacterium]